MTSEFYVIRRTCLNSLMEAAGGIEPPLMALQATTIIYISIAYKYNHLINH